MLGDFNFVATMQFDDALYTHFPHLPHTLSTFGSSAHRTHQAATGIEPGAAAATNMGMAANPHPVTDTATVSLAPCQASNLILTENSGTEGEETSGRQRLRGRTVIYSTFAVMRFASVPDLKPFLKRRGMVFK